ncbi:MAG TPA: hypothetical protein GX726_05320 [Clostridiales bacterium]|nr:hypothetical protein [Clostridiales bacterium]
MQRLKTKKSILLALFLTLALSLTVISTALAGTAPTVKVGSIDNVAAGTDSVTIPVSIENNPGFASFTLGISYDSDLTLTAITGGSAAGDLIPTLSLTPNVAGGKVEFTTAGNIIDNGVLFYLTFSVSATTTAGDKQVSITIPTNEGFFSDGTGEGEGGIPQNITSNFSFNHGSIKVAAAAPEQDTSIDLADFVDGVYTISQGGNYNISADAAGIIRITTTEAVKLTGNVSTGKLANLSIDYTVAGGNLTIEDLWIDRPESSNTIPVIDFMGVGNKFYFIGENYLQCSASYSAASACIHVGPDAAATIDGSGKLSMYAGSGGSCIGGADAESNGDISINGGTIYAYSSRAASTIGSGQKVDATGKININGGDLYLFANARGAAIGSGGMSGGTVGDGAPVTVTGGNITTYVSFTGSAIGNGGGNQSANDLGLGDAEPSHGTLTVSGGSIKTIMLVNSFFKWGLSGDADQINDLAITATKQNAAGAPVYLLTLSLAGIDANGTGPAYVVKEGETTLYSGDIIRNYNANTTGMWPAADPATDANLYLYLTGTDHTLNVNGKEVTYSFDAANSTFTKAAAPAGAWDGTVDTSWYNTTDTSFTLADGADLAGLSAIVGGTAENIAQDSFKGKTVKLAGDILLNADGVISGATAAENAQKFTPIGSGANSFKGTFDGQGHAICGLYVNEGQDYGDDTGHYLGLFGAIGGTDTPGEAGYGVVKNFKLYGLVKCTDTRERGAGNDFVGAVCGILRAGGTICDVINYAQVEAADVTNVGGIAGFAGTPVGGAGDGIYTANPSGYNTFILRCGNEATIHGYYKLGGIVGENAATVMYCYNHGYILPHMHGSGGGWGGIAGRNGNNNAAVEEAVIAYCYNTAMITNNGKNDVEDETIKGYGGIVGMGYGAHGRCEIYNCYNIGPIPVGRNNYNSIASGTEGLCSVAVRNNYSLISPQINNYSDYDREKGVQVTEADFKKPTYGDDDILTLLGPYYTADTTNINNGFPILRWQAGKDISTPTAISIVTAPTKVAYAATQSFDPAGMVVKATFADGSAAIVSDQVTYRKDALAIGDQSITISYTFNGATVTADQAITVSGLSLDSIAVTAAPTKTIYVKGESFEKDGMVVTASFNEGAVTKTLEATDYIVTPDPLTAGLTEVTVSYNFAEGQTQTVTQAVTVMDAFPVLNGSFYELEDAADLIWFSDRVSVMGERTINARLMNNIDLSNVDWQPIGGAMNAAGTSYVANINSAYLGEFDGNDKTITLAIDVSGSANSYRGLFACIGAATIGETLYTANVHDLTIAGSINVSGANYTAAIAACNIGGNIANCVNTATISSTNGIAGGIVGHMSGGGLSNCKNLEAISGGSNIGGVVGYCAAATATIDNCVNKAAVTSSSNTVGGIAGYMTGIITNCYNDAPINGSGTVGGVVGNFAGTSAEISNCANLADIISSGNAVGGIAGSANGKIEKCFNIGAVQGTHYVAGISGNNRANITDCYNRGNVTGTGGTQIYQASGGIAGLGNTATYTNVYNSGKVAAPFGSGIVGVSNNSIFTINNGYYLAGTADQAYLERTADKVIAIDVAVKSEAELKALAATLGEKFKAGAVYPILSWQADETPVQADDIEANNGTVTAEVPADTPVGVGADVLIDAQAETDQVTKAQVTIPAAVAQNLDQAASMTINTNMGEVTFDHEALSDIADDTDLYLNIEQKSAEDDAIVFELTLRNSAGEDVFTRGTANVKLPYTLPAGKSADSVQVFYVAEDGTRTQIDCTYADGFVYFTVNHFSTYSVEANELTITATTAVTHVNAGETFDVAVKVTGQPEQQFTSMSADLSYNDAQVEYVSFTAGDGTTAAGANDNTAANKIEIQEAGANKTVGANGFLIGTVKLKALTTIPAGITKTTLSLSDTQAVRVGASGNPNPAAAVLAGDDAEVNLANITITFQAGGGTTMAAATAYAKYGVAGLYTSNSYADAFTVPTPVAEQGYRLADSVWSDGTNRYTNDMVVKAYTANAIMTAQSVRIGGSGGGGGQPSGDGSGDQTSNNVKDDNSDKPATDPSIRHFNDVSATHWAYRYVEKMAEQELIKGKEPEMFYPDDNITRAEFITILARMSGDTLPEGRLAATKFSDIKSGAYYAPAVVWAINAGVTAGTSDAAFSPDQPIARQDVAVMIYRYTAYKQISLPKITAAINFTDQGSIGDYAKAAVGAMQQANIINGYGDGSFRPQGLATRAEIAKMLCLVLDM